MDAKRAADLAKQVLEGEELTTNDETLFRAYSAAVVPLRLLARSLLVSTWVECQCHEDDKPPF